MAVYTPKKLYTGQPGTTATTLYTAPASTTTIIKNIIICNTTATDATLTLSLVPSGGSAGTTNRIMSALVIKANDTVAMDLSGLLSTGDFISALQGTSAALTVHISGVEVV
jgi:hypothetical protein